MPKTDIQPIRRTYSIVLFCLAICSFIVFGGLFFYTKSSQINAQNTHTDNQDNFGLITDQQPASTNFSLDSAIDFVGGDASPTGQPTNIMHGYHFLDEPISEINISQITAVPQKRLPSTGNNQMYFLMEILPANSVYNTSSVIWSNASSAAADRLTDIHGEWQGNYAISTLAAGNYDIYLRGLSHLSKKITNYSLITGNNALDFTLDENSLDSGTILPNNPQYYYLAGDAATKYDSDLSCAGNAQSCPFNPGSSYTGDEWGDDYVNGLDMSTIVQRSFANTNVIKEDLNGDGYVNGLDIGIAHANLLKGGASYPNF